MWRDLLNNAWLAFYFMLMRPVWKWLLHKYTGRCELLRISYNHEEGAGRTKQIEKSLKHSGISVLRQLSKAEEVHIDNATADVMRIKAIVPEVHPRFEGCFKVCLCQICGYKKLVAEIQTLKQETYNADDPEHERKLIQLWTTLNADKKLESRVSDDWKELGFQGDDPKTDFRGMGILGLNQLLYFATKYTDKSLQLLSHSKHPKLWYPYAVVGINLTSVLYDLLIKGVLRTHFYNISRTAPTLDQFHDVYCYVFFEFDKFWFGENPKDVMEFGRVRDKFQKKLQHKLKSDLSTTFILDFGGKTES